MVPTRVVHLEDAWHDSIEQDPATGPGGCRWSPDDGDDTLERVGLWSTVGT